MKKIYETPKIDVVKIDLVEIVASSEPEVVVDTTENVDAEVVQSRRHNVWDDEDDWN